MSGEQYNIFWEEMQKNYECIDKGFVSCGIGRAAYTIQLIPHNTPHSCPNCKHNKCDIHEHKLRLIHGGTVNGASLVFALDDIRYRCSRCKKTFFDKHKGLKTKHRISIDADEFMLRSIGSITFSEIADMVGITVQTVANRAQEYADEERELMLKGHYQYLSMDEVFIGRDSKGNHSIYWVLNGSRSCRGSQNIMVCIGRTQEEVEKRLKLLAYPNEIVAVSIDMWQGYLNAIQKVFPNAHVVIDRFHVLQTASKQMIALRKSLICGNWLKNKLKEDTPILLKPFFSLTNSELQIVEHDLAMHKDLEKMYFIFQELLEFYSIRDYDEALEYLCKWETRVLASKLPQAKELYDTIYHWLPYIMNFFLYRITNGKTEGKNNLIRMIDRMGFHYGSNCLQGCLYAHDRKQEAIKWRRKQRKLWYKLYGSKDHIKKVKADTKVNMAA